MEQVQKKTTWENIINPRGERYFNSRRKRWMDVIGATIGLGVLFPVIGISAAIVKLQDGGPAFFSQERVGKDGNVFTIYKIRSMNCNADQEGTPLYKPVEDKRTTPFGKLLRRTSIDELPQLWNVLKGDMSLVGPRPSEVEDHSKKSWICGQYFEDNMADMTLSKPGLTGLSGINGRGILRQDKDGIRQSVGYEYTYKEHATLGLDAFILLKTVGAVISGKGAY